MIAPLPRTDATKATVKLALLMLPALQRRVLIRRYGLEGHPVRSLVEIARVERLSVLEVRLLEVIALETLREKLSICQVPPGQNYFH